MIRVLVVVEQDESKDSSLPVTQTFQWKAGVEGVGQNPRFLGDSLQRAVIVAATEALRNLSGFVELRDGETTFERAETLLAVVEGSA